MIPSKSWPAQGLLVFGAVMVSLPFKLYFAFPHELCRKNEFHLLQKVNDQIPLCIPLPQTVHQQHMLIS